METITGVGRRRSHGRKRGVKYHGSKKSWFVYGFKDEEFFSRKISALEVPWYLVKVRPLKSFKCENCGTKLRSTMKEPECPICGSSISS